MSNTPSPTSVETITVTETRQLLNINMSNVTKLTSNNFLMWSRQVHALLDGYELAAHLDEITAPPSTTVMVNNTPVTNPEFTLWKRQDKLIYSSLLGAISNTIQPLLSTTETAAAIWSKLTATYAKPSRGHIKQLKQQMKQWTKGTKSIDEYVQGLQSRFDQLSLLGKAIDLEDQIEQILEGLPDGYRSVADAIEGRDTPPSLTEVHQKLLNQEAKLKAAEAGTTHHPVSAHAAQTKSSNNNNFRANNNKNNYRNNKPWQHHSQQQQQQYSPRPYQGKCQICGVFGHSARRCSQLLQGTSFQPQQINSSPWQPRAHAAMTQSSPHNSWLLDSGASHHITTDLNNLAIHQLYTGGEEVTIANGSTIPISHTGSGILPTPSKSLALHDMLFVPTSNKNLLSVYRLCNNNKVSIEFFPHSFQVKDLTTGVQLIRGKTKNNLYEWPKDNFTSFYASPTSKTDMNAWHSRLGHPSLSTLKTIVSRFHLPISTPINNDFKCKECLINKNHKLSFSTNTISSKHPLEILYSDVWTSPTLSYENHKYYLLIVDHFTRYSWLYPLQKKSQVKETFIAFKSLVEKRFNQQIRVLYSDNGGEYVVLRPFLREAGISHLTTPPHTPELNGISERKHRHIVETGLSLLSQSGIPHSY